MPPSQDEDVTDRAVDFLFDRLEIDPDVCLRNLFSLFERCPVRRQDGLMQYGMTGAYVRPMLDLSLRMETARCTADRCSPQEDS